VGPKPIILCLLRQSSRVWAGSISEKSSGVKDRNAHQRVCPLAGKLDSGRIIRCSATTAIDLRASIVTDHSMSRKSTPRPTPSLVHILVLVLLCAIFIQATGSAARTSITIDEGLHITSGYTILRTGDFRLVEEHPPVVKVWAALPLLSIPDLPDPRTLRAWDQAAEPTTESLPLLQMTQQFLYPYRPIDRLVFAARVPVALLAVLLGAVVFRWGADLWGRNGGLLALFFLAFDPNIIAHAAVTGTDLGAACFITLALFTLARFLRRPTLPRLVLAGVALGLAQGAKLSAVMLLPATLLLGVLGLPWRRLPLLLLIIGIAGLVFWGVYGFELGSIPGVPFPVPAASHSIPWQRLREHMAEGHAAFLLGENSSRGWWYYFPVAFGLKTPLPTLILLVVAATTAMTSRRRLRNNPFQPLRRSLLDEGCVLLFPLVYGTSSLFSPLNIGYRHLLPILPLLFVFLARITNCQPRITSQVSRFTFRPLRITHYALLIWYLIGTLRIFPHYLAYFNELAGGPDGGWRYLADSNTDWGQAYKDLAQFQQEQGIGTVRLSAFIFYDPAIYGVAFEPLTPMRGDTPAVFPSRFNPPPGDYVISATTLDGIPMVDPEMYDWFRKREPDAKIGYALFYYRVPSQDLTPEWLAQCTAPVAPIPYQIAAEGFGRDDLRMAYFDCTQAWLYPAGGRSPGWFILFRGEETKGDFTQAHQAVARLTYEQRIPRGVPSFSIYEWSPDSPGRIMNNVQTGPVIVAPSDWAPAQAESSGQTLTTPLSVSGLLTFLGYRLSADTIPAGKTLELWTYWSVTDPPDFPLSLMAHLLDKDGQAVAVGDGLAVPIESWQASDVIVQRHMLEIPQEIAPGAYWVQTGAYRLTDMQRLTVVSEGQPAADRILLTRLEIAAP
jgi:hypothetical protein